MALIALLAVAAAPPALTDFRDGNDPARRVVGTARLDADAVRLSGEVRLTLTVEGPGPLSVTPPKPLLTQGNLWRVREDGLPVREVAGGRETWTQVYRLSPLVAGRPEVPLGPVAVQPGSGAAIVLDWPDRKGPEFAVRVTTSIESPSADLLRPPADIETLPPPPPVEDRRSPSWFAVVPALLLISVGSLLLGRRRRPAAVRRDAAWALAELAHPDLSADRCALVLRQYLRFRFGVPAEARTTPELAAALRGIDRLPAGAVADWQGLLDDCDAARFSGTAAAVGGLADRARAIVQSIEPESRNGHEEARRDTKS